MNRICHCSGTLIGIVAIITLLAGTQAQAAGGVVEDPIGTAPDRYLYYPGTEALDADEVRIVARGTSMPKSTGWRTRTGEMATGTMKKNRSRK